MRKLKNKTDGILNFMDYKKPLNKCLYITMIVILSIMLLISMFPLIWLILSSFKDANEIFTIKFNLFPKEISFKKITDSWKLLNISRYLTNSLIVVIGATFCSVFFNGLLAYAISVLKPKGYKIIYVLIMATMMIPAIMNMRPLLNNIKELGLMGSYIPIILSYGANAFYFIMFKVYFDNLPKDIFEAAIIDGCNRMQMFFRIVVPMSLPIIMVVAIYTVNASWSDFMLPYLVLQQAGEKQTLIVRIFAYNNTSSMTIDRMLMLLTMSIIPVIIIFAIFQKRITNNSVNSGIKG